MERQLNQNLLKILNIINDHKEHIPSITTTEGNPFPYQVSRPAINDKAKVI
jgi:autophagy-related protein 101